MKKITLLFIVLYVSILAEGQSVYFGAKQTLSSENLFYSLQAAAAGDVDGDDKLDIIAERSSTNKLVLIDDIWGSATATEQSHLGEFVFNPYGSALADFDGDGDLDYVVAGPDGNNDTSANIIYYYDGTQNRFEKYGTTFEISSVKFYGFSVKTGDFTGDNKDDIIWFGNSGVYLGVNNTTKTDTLDFTISRINTTILSYSDFKNLGSGLGDFNGDGNLDFVKIDTRPNSNAYGGLYHLGLGNGSGSFTYTTPSLRTDSLLSWSVSVADFDQNGKDDFVIARVKYTPYDKRQITIFTRNAANNGFDTQNILSSYSNPIYHVFTEDVNTDGFPDIILTSDEQSDPNIHLNQGDGTFVETADGSITSNAIYEMYFNDVNGGTCNNQIIATETDKVVSFSIHVQNQSSIDVNGLTQYTVPSGDEIHTTSGVYYDTISGVGGCDSVLRINVTIGVLPIELFQLYANFAPDASSIDLHWTTMSERNSDLFDIERSRDGENWLSIGAVKASGETNNMIYYTYSDIDPNFGNNYYRLKMIDKDGSFEYSDVIYKEFFIGSNIIHIYPNPAKDYIDLLTYINDIFYYKIYQNGRFVISGKHQLQSSINLKGLVSGNYQLILLNEFNDIVDKQNFIIK